MITSIRSSLLFSGNCLRKPSSRNISSTDLVGDASPGGQALELNPASLGEGERPSNQPYATYTEFQGRHPSLYGLPQQGSPLREISSLGAALQETPQSIASQPLGQRIWNFLKMLTTQTLPTNPGVSVQGGHGDIERGNQPAENANRDEQELRDRVRALGRITIDLEPPVDDSPTAPRLGDGGPPGTTSTELHRRHDAMAFSH